MGAAGSALDADRPEGRRASERLRAVLRPRHFEEGPATFFTGRYFMPSSLKRKE
jgi:hypothetical protein